MGKWGRHFNGLVRSSDPHLLNCRFYSIYNSFQERKSTVMLTERSANGGRDAAHRPYVVEVIATRYEWSKPLWVSHLTVTQSSYVWVTGFVAYQLTRSGGNENRSLLGLTLRFATNLCWHHSHLSVCFLFLFFYSNNILSQATQI